MAVFTPVATHDLVPWLSHFSAGTLLRLEGIESGIENSNFFVTTSSGEFVLTLFERLGEDELPFYLELMEHLNERGILCPRPARTRAGSLFLPLNGKPAALVAKLRGRSKREVGPAECQVTASALGRMHLAAADFHLRQPNPRGLGWWHDTVPLIAPHLAPAQAELVQDEVAAVALALRARLDGLPRGPIHADLFRDNVLFEGDELGGFIDFYFAGCDAWLFDLAVCINDWCIVQASGEVIAPLAQSFLTAYADVRAFTDEEREAWPWMLRAAALRFWLSRLADVVLPRQAALLTPHDPRHFERIVLKRRAEAKDTVAPLP